MSKIKPCSCGNKDVTVEIQQHEHDENEKWSVEIRCNCCGNHIYRRGFYKETTQSYAIENWNKFCATKDIVQLECFHFWSDWTTFEKVDINLNKYQAFRIDYRCDSWHVMGYRYDGYSEKWEQDELSIHQACPQSLISFIKELNKRNKPIYEFRNYHNSNGFANSLQKLLCNVFESDK